MVVEAVDSVEFLFQLVDLVLTLEPEEVDLEL